MRYISKDSLTFNFLTTGATISLLKPPSQPTEDDLRNFLSNHLKSHIQIRLKIGNSGPDIATLEIKNEKLQGKVQDSRTQENNNLVIEFIEMITPLLLNGQQQTQEFTQQSFAV